MVQKKGRKNIPKVHASTKEKDGSKLNAQLRDIGLRVVNITADGNCLFRAVADQLEGNEEEHLKYRKMVVDFIEAHREDFEPFIEDEVPFDDYCRSMREASTWAGNMELQAVSLVTGSNICIHRILSPRWHIQNFNSVESRCIHLSYHNGEHYNSIRRIDDCGDGPAKTIKLETPPAVKEDIESRGGKERRPTKNAPRLKKQSKSAVKEISQEEGCNDMVDDVGDLPETHSEGCSNEDFQNGGDDEHILSDKSSLINANGHASQQEVKKISRNKVCPCGSRKKYKACCGVVRVPGRPPEGTGLSEGLSNKARKEVLRNNKEAMRNSKEHMKTQISKGTEGSLDLGYLCI